MKTLKIVALLNIVFTVAACNIATESDFDRASKDMCECTSKDFEKLSPEFKKDFIEASEKNLNFDKTLDILFNKRKENGNDAQNLSDALMFMQLPTTVEKCLKELEPKYKDLKTLDSETETINKFMQSIENQADCKFLYAILKTINTRSKK